MAERLEGWHVPWHRAAVAAAIVPFALLTVLLLAGWGYRLAWRPSTFRPVTPFPAPGVETHHVRATREQDAPEPKGRDDLAVGVAKASVAAGLPDWRPLDPAADCQAARSPSCLKQLPPAAVPR